MAFKKFFRRAKNAVKRRYTKKSGGVKFTRIVKDVMLLKKLVNVEKKRCDYVISSGSVGQVNVNYSGSNALDVTPIVASGAGYNQRNGASIKIVSMFVKFQFWQQVNNSHPMKVRIELWKVKGIPVTAPTLLQDLYNVNASSTIIDYNSLRNPDYYGDATKICTKSFMIDSYFTNQVAIKDVIIPLKLQHHIRYDRDTALVTEGDIYMFIFADSGNMGGGASTLANLPVTTLGSGLFYNMDMKYYYVDN